MIDGIRLVRHAAWHVLTLDRPDKMNACTGDMLIGLRAMLEDAAADPACRAVLLTGAGRAFCAGQDLSETRPGVDVGATLDRTYNPLIRTMRAMRLPIVCAVNGVAAGAGANIALACDIVLAARSASFIQAFARIGLLPDAGGTFHLPRLVGEARARALMMLAEPVTAEHAASWGMIWRVVDDTALMTEAEALTARLATAPTQALALIKRALAASSANTLDAQLDVERDCQREAARTPDFTEGVRAFLEKRPPEFTGRTA